MSDLELETYPDPRYIGSDNDIEYKVKERDDSTFTMTSGTVSLYDHDGTLTHGPITDSDGRFDIDGVYLRYQLNLNTGAYSGDLYRVEWQYASSSKVYTEQCLLEVRDVPH